MIRCMYCGRRLTRAAATVDTAAGTGHAGPTCARKAGLLAPKVTRPRMVTSRRRSRRDDAQAVLL